MYIVPIYFRILLFKLPDIFVVLLVCVAAKKNLKAHCGELLSLAMVFVINIAKFITKLPVFK